MESGLGQKVFFITLGGPKAHDSSVEKPPRKVRGTPPDCPSHLGSYRMFTARAASKARVASEMLD